jgi:endonuclease III
MHHGCSFQLQTRPGQFCGFALESYPMNKSISAHELHINLEHPTEEALFKWLIASFLMGKRIQADIAAEAYRVIVEKHQRDTPRKLSNCTHRELVTMLGEAHYVRYDETTASRLLALVNKLNDEYGGKVRGLLEVSADRQAFEKRLAEFEGIGPKTVEIFMRDAGKALF